jgi:hypothetical protein
LNLFINYHIDNGVRPTRLRFFQQRLIGEYLIFSAPFVGSRKSGFGKYKPHALKIFYRGTDMLAKISIIRPINRNGSGSGFGRNASGNYQSYKDSQGKKRSNKQFVFHKKLLTSLLDDPLNVVPSKLPAISNAVGVEKQPVRLSLHDSVKTAKSVNNILFFSMFTLLLVKL